MTRKLVDPVHFFNAKGQAMVNVAHLEARNRELEAQVERLTELLKAQVEKNARITQADPTPILH